MTLSDHSVSQSKELHSPAEFNKQARKRGSHKRHFVLFPLKQRQTPYARTMPAAPLSLHPRLPLPPTVTGSPPGRRCQRYLPRLLCSPRNTSLPTQRQRGKAERLPQSWGTGTGPIRGQRPPFVALLGKRPLPGRPAGTSDAACTGGTLPPLRRGVREPAPPRDALPKAPRSPAHCPHSPTPYFSCSVGIHMLAAASRPPGGNPCARSGGAGSAHAACCSRRALAAATRPRRRMHCSPRRAGGLTSWGALAASHL